MITLIVNTPSGLQEAIEVSDSGGYFDPARIVWSTKPTAAGGDGPLPVGALDNLGGLVKANGALEFSAERMAEHVIALRPSIRQRINAARTAAIYKDETIPFPFTPKTIQFRNDQDRQNLSDKVTGAIALVLSNQGSTSMNYVCADNSVATMTAAQFIAAGQSVLQAKDAVFYAYKQVKDVLETATTAEDLAAVEAALAALQD